MSDVSSSDLASLQHWMQDLVRFPGDLAEGPGGALIGERLLPSAKLTAKERLDIYSEQYFLRLGGVLEEDFPATRFAMGRDEFWRAVRGYLVKNPSRSYTLNVLGAGFAEFLKGVPHASTTFLHELASLEWACQVQFHAEGDRSIRSEDLAEVPLERWAGARLVPIRAFSLHAFTYPVNAYLSAIKRGEEKELPEPSRTHVACYRKDFRVWRMDLEPPTHGVLSALARGATLEEAVEHAVRIGADPQEVGASLSSWFGRWMKEGFFREILFPS